MCTHKENTLNHCMLVSNPIFKAVVLYLAANPTARRAGWRAYGWLKNDIAAALNALTSEWLNRGSHPALNILNTCPTLMKWANGSILPNGQSSRKWLGWDWDHLSVKHSRIWRMGTYWIFKYFKKCFRSACLATVIINTSRKALKWFIHWRTHSNIEYLNSSLHSQLSICLLASPIMFWSPRVAPDF